jgi:sulfatase maturation enzyme AslB (radical SAM superfamily)
MKHRIFEIVDVNEADQLMKPDGTVDIKPIALDVRFGSLCNAKCIMCNAAHSSLWKEDMLKLEGLINPKFSQQEIVNSSRWWETDRWWEQFEKIAPNLRSLYSLGGEPLIVPEHDTMLEKLVEWGYAKDIELEYDTNLTVINPKLIKLWKQFKNIVLRVSIDETEDRYHLVRFPSNWNRLIKNIDTLTAEGIPITGFTSSIGLATIYSPFRLQKFSEQYNINYFQRFLYTPEMMNITILPESAKQEIIETYENNLDKTGQTGLGIINHLKNNFDSHNPDAIKLFVRYMDKLDEIRNTNWRQTLPDIFDLLSRHCPESFTK